MEILQALNFYVGQQKWAAYEQYAFVDRSLSILSAVIGTNMTHCNAPPITTKSTVIIRDAPP